MVERLQNRDRRKEATPRPALLDVVQIDGRWAQVAPRLDCVIFLDEKVQGTARVVPVQWDDYTYTPMEHHRKFGRSNAWIDDLLADKSISVEEFQHVHWGPEQKQNPGLKKFVTVFGRYTSKQKQPMQKPGVPPDTALTYMNQRSNTRGIGELLPLGFQPKEQSLIFLRGEVAGQTRNTIVGEVDGYGIRRAGLLWTTEMYTSAHEPHVTPFSKQRLILWHPLVAASASVHGSGWIRNPLAHRQFQKGVAVLEDDTYWQQWSSHAQRHRKKWTCQREYEMVETSIELFAAAYHATKKLGPITRATFIQCLRYHLQRNPDCVRLFAARERATQHIIAGLAVIQYADISQSFHTISFMHPRAQHTSVGVGLIDHWYQACLRERIRFLNFGVVWRRGDPRAWRGYSQFKRQFYLFEYLPQPTRIRCVGAESVTARAGS